LYTFYVRFAWATPNFRYYFGTSAIVLTLSSLITNSYNYLLTDFSSEGVTSFITVML